MATRRIENRSPTDELYCEKDHSNVTVLSKSFFEDHDNGIIYEQVNDNCYVRWDKGTDKWKLVDHIHTMQFVPGKKEKSSEIVYMPLINETVDSGQIVLPDHPIPTTSLVDIFNEIEEKSKKWLYISDEELPIFRVQIRVAVASWFLYVYRDPKIQERVAGLSGVVGTSGGGKKRWLTFMKMIAYRPIYLLNTQRIPSVFRLAESWVSPTLLIDEADQKDTGAEAEWVQFVNARYDGTPVPRYNASTGLTEIFKSFGLTCIALRRMPKDEGTTGRMTKINATISPIIVPEVAGADIYTDFQEIRNKLLYLRLRFYPRLKFVGLSGLPAEQSWRGKETLTLFRILEQIDPKIDTDINEISQALTLREVQNLAGTWDGLIINELNSFITDEKTTYREKHKAIYFLRPYTDKEGEEKLRPLNLKYLADSLGDTASAIQRGLSPQKIDTFERFRIEGIDKAQRGVLMFRYLDDTDRIFMRYVPDYDHKLSKIAKELGLGKQETLDQEEKTKSVPHVPVVPPHDIPPLLINNNNISRIYTAGTSGTSGTKSEEQKEEKIEQEKGIDTQTEQKQTETDRMFIEMLTDKIFSDENRDYNEIKGNVLYIKKELAELLIKEGVAKKI